jgi:transposase
VKIGTTCRISFPRDGQNIVASTMLLHNMPEPSNSQARRIRDEVQCLLHMAAAQQAKSSASRRRGAATEKCPEPARNERDVSVNQEPPPQGKKTVPIQERLINNREPRDAHNEINEHRCRKHGDAEERGYSAHCGTLYDSDEDRMAPEPPGPRVFSRAIHSTPLPSPF